MIEFDKLEQGKIYFIAYGENTQVLARFKEIELRNLVFFDHLHYWNGFESFRKGGHSVMSGITELRRATKPEIHAIVRHEIDNGCL